MLPGSAVREELRRDLVGPLRYSSTSAAGLTLLPIRSARIQITGALSQNRLDTLAADDVEEHECRTARPLGALLQLRHVTDCEVEIADKDRLA